MKKLMMISMMLLMTVAFVNAQTAVKSTTAVQGTAATNPNSNAPAVSATSAMDHQAAQMTTQGPNSVPTCTAGAHSCSGMNGKACCSKDGSMTGTSAPTPGGMAGQVVAPKQNEASNMAPKQ